MATQKMSLKFIKKVQLARETYSFYFTKPKNFNFLAGQYLKLWFDKSYDDNTAYFFTIASSPLQPFLMITTKTTSQSNLKKKLLTLDVGEKVYASGPQGGFIFDEKNSNYVFLAGGIGITPFHSMILYASAKNLKNKILLIASFSSIEQLIFADELSSIASEHKNIRVVYTISNSKTKNQLE